MALVNCYEKAVMRDFLENTNLGSIIIETK